MNKPVSLFEVDAPLPILSPIRPFDNPTHTMRADSPIRVTLDLYEASAEEVKEQLADLSWQLADRLKNHEGHQYRFYLCVQIVKDMVHPYGDKVAISERPEVIATTHESRL